MNHPRVDELDIPCPQGCSEKVGQAAIWMWCLMGCVLIWMAPFFPWSEGGTEDGVPVGNRNLCVSWLNGIYWLGAMLSSMMWLCVAFWNTEFCVRPKQKGLIWALWIWGSILVLIPIVAFPSVCAT